MDWEKFLDNLNNSIYNKHNTKNIEDINFDNIDLSEFKKDIVNLQQKFDKIIKNKRLMKILNKKTKL